MLVRLKAAIAAVAAVAATAHAAEIISAQHGSEAVLEGNVEPGDCAKLKRFAFDQRPEALFLASPGGDLAEAMRIGRLVRALRLRTEVPTKWTGRDISELALSHNLKAPRANYICTSACFFIFVAGIDRRIDYNFGADTYHPPLLGIHRPYLSGSGLKSLSAVQAITAVGRVRGIVQEYLKQMGVSAKYVELMFSVPKDNVRMIGANAFNADFAGVIPELRNWLDVKCVDKRTNAEKPAKKMKEKSGCELQALFDLRHEAWQSVYGSPGGVYGSPGAIYGSIDTPIARSYCKMGN